MGTLTYGTGQEITLDDRTLSHLQIAMGLKLRRQEGASPHRRQPKGPHQ